jgi:creatinine amidohydrolase
MKVSSLNWREVEQYLRQDDRAVVPLGSTEQHAGLSLATDAILAERVAVEAAEPLGVPVFPVLSYGVTPYFMAFPGTVSLAPETYLRVIAEIFDSLAAHGFRRIVVVNGHGGNSFAQTAGWELARRHRGVRVKFHNWWNAPATWARVQQAAPVAGHASWMENFPWTRLPSTDASLPPKPAADMAAIRMLAPEHVRERIGDGNLGGAYQLPDDVMDAIWQAGVAETRHAIANDWPPA